MPAGGARPGADADLRPGHLMSDPAHVLYDALRALPAVAPQRGRAERAARRGAGCLGGGGPGGRGAGGLPRRGRGAARRHGVDRVRDVAEVAAALPQLDADLAGWLPGRTSPPNRAVPAGCGGTGTYRRCGTPRCGSRPMSSPSSATTVGSSPARSACAPSTRPSRRRGSPPTSAPPPGAGSPPATRRPRVQLAAAMLSKHPPSPQPGCRRHRTVAPSTPSSR
jgi:hypothetical protein